MKFAYADPPYIGCAHRYDHAEAHVYDTLTGHLLLLDRLQADYPDGWAYSCNMKDLFEILPNMRFQVQPRILTWCKSFAAFKAGVTRAYTTEAVLFHGGREITREQPTVRDHLVCPITLKKGLCGAKPDRFCKEWILDWLSVQKGDTLDDLFPGTGIMGKCFEARLAQGRMFA